MAWSKWDIGCCCGEGVCEGGCECSVTENYTDDFDDDTIDGDWNITDPGTSPIVEDNGSFGVPPLALTGQTGQVERCLVLDDMTDKRLYVRFTAGPVDLAGKLQVYLKVYQCVLDGSTPTCEIGANTFVQWNDGVFLIYGYGYSWSDCIRNSDSAISDGDYIEPGGANPSSKTFAIEIEWLDSIDNIVQLTLTQDGSDMESSEMTLGNGSAPVEKAVLVVYFDAHTADGTWIQEMEFGVEDA